MSALLALALLSAQASACAALTLPAGTVVSLVTTGPLSSKTSVKGDMVTLQLAADVLVDGHVVVAKGSAATGQVAEARAKGGLGVDGRLILRPLYFRIGARVVRLSGVQATDGGVAPGAVVGLVALPVLSGRSAQLPAGSPVWGRVERSVDLPASVRPGC